MKVLVLALFLSIALASTASNNSKVILNFNIKNEKYSLMLDATNSPVSEHPKLMENVFTAKPTRISVRMVRVQ